MTTTEVGSRIKEEELERLRRKIGVVKPVAERYNTEASRDGIRHYAQGTGDLNPLWNDEEYANRSRYGTLVAPPTFLFSCGQGQSGGLPGVHGMYSGSAWEFDRPVRLGERVDAFTQLLDLVEKRSEFAGRMFQQYDETVFRTPDGERLGRLVIHIMRTERDTAAKKGKYQAIEPHVYTDAEIAEIDAAYAAEEIRGATPRYWEEVTEGEALPQIVRGPLTVTDMLAWNMGFGGVYIRAHGLAYAYRRKHPRAFITNERGVPDIPERVHWDPSFAKKVGVPDAYDYGPQRAAWMGVLVTNWMSDAGWLRRLDVQLRRFNLVGDTTWCRGKVARRYVENGEHLVDLELSGENQRGEVTAPGTATVVLPSRTRST